MQATKLALSSLHNVPTGPTLSPRAKSEKKFSRSTRFSVIVLKAQSELMVSSVLLSWGPNKARLKLSDMQTNQEEKSAIKFCLLLLDLLAKVAHTAKPSVAFIGH